VVRVGEQLEEYLPVRSRRSRTRGAATAGHARTAGECARRGRGHSAGRQQLIASPTTYFLLAFIGVVGVINNNGSAGV
jgi:hypothetical protein